MELLQSRTRQLIRTALASNTSLTYTTAMNVFLKFRSDYNLSNLYPIPVSHITLFMAYCFEKGLSPKTITTYLAGVNYFHKLQGFTDLSSNFVIKKMLEGCHRNRMSNDKRAPLTKNILVDICSKLATVCYNNYETSLFMSLFTLAYFGLFRASELTLARAFHVCHALLVDDLTFLTGNKYVVICLRHFKTHQRGGPVFIKLPCQNETLCPVKNLLNFLEIRPKSQTLLFCHQNGTPVTRSQFAHVLHLAFTQSRFGFGHFRTHSFRIGRATDLAAQGVPAEIIMKLGRWSSTCFRLYIRM